jgi:hypothetical protein
VISIRDCAYHSGARIAYRLSGMLSLSAAIVSWAYNGGMGQERGWKLRILGGLGLAWGVGGVGVFLGLLLAFSQIFVGILYFILESGLSVHGGEGREVINEGNWWWGGDSWCLFNSYPLLRSQNSILEHPPWKERGKTVCDWADEMFASVSD